MMKYIILLFSVFSFGQELTLTTYVSGPLGLPSKGNYEVYSTGFSFGYDKFSLGYGHSRIFGNSFSAGVYLPKPRLAVNHTYYYNNPYQPQVNPWGSWVSIRKTFTIWKRKKRPK